MRLFATAFFLLGTVCAAQAQETAPPETNGKTEAVPRFVAVSAPRPSFIHSLTAGDASFFPAAKPIDTFAAPVVATALALPLDAAEPAAPSPKPRLLYGSREDYRWQLGLGVDWIRFRSSVFNASAVGINTSLTYFTNEWLAIEGNVSTAFAPQIFDREHVKLLVYGAGPKIAWRQKRWEPWAHAILGGVRLQPQTAGNSKNSYSIQLGGGADYRWNPRLSFRLQGDFLRTGFFNQSQNNFQLTGGFVLHM